ncbi:LysR family transcriptional regulator [Ketobacter sp. MCCC 1A13808]|uniref:LysR family transcriptional regulator n=1 Tax=Ketobacter sp. MCCC 1A13808 TaxID=2602738 RepID=UPI000F261F3B|nr:LysR family transcriptional regulator [Ketobacter sp. MCCC 1A13808]MVF14223.1 LysR family transcriptional regulator [Ketobacter sp. MCCC 1A13808]RLP54128.1 MAG: LysR family transcriptional regulator [Ketobacter sp.]
MRSQELTLLYVFDAIMTEGSVTLAANRLSMTQPAVSNAIARMRDHWQDPLFVKKGRQIEPTAFARSLWEQVRDPMHFLSTAVESSVFEPSESRRKFRIAIADMWVDLFWLPLLEKVSQQAPNVDLYAVPYTLGGVVTQLREANVDLVLGPLNQHDSSLRSRFLMSNVFRLVMRRNHPLSGTPVSMADYLAARHLLVSQSGDARGIVDSALQQEGLHRRVAMTVNHFSAVPKLLTHSDLIAVVPEVVAGGTQYRSELWITDPPMAIDPVPVYLIWHTRLDRDPGLTWMRNLLEETVQLQWNKCTRCAQGELHDNEELDTLT